MDTLNSLPPEVSIDPDGEVWWDATALAAALCCCERTARERAKRPGFPAAYDLGDNIVRWRAEQVREWRERQRREVRLATPREWQPSPAPTPVRGKGKAGPRPRRAA